MADYSMMEEVVSTCPTKKCQHCGQQCAIAFRSCPSCNENFPDCLKRQANGPVRQHPSSLVTIMQKKANQLNQLGYDIFILGHKRNAVNPSHINFTTPGIAKEFVKDYPKLFEGWKTYCSSKSRGQNSNHQVGLSTAGENEIGLTQTATQSQVGLTQTATQGQVGLTQTATEDQELTQTATQIQVGLTQTATQSQGLTQTATEGQGLTQTATQSQVGLTQTATQSQVGLMQTQSQGLTQTATEGQVELTQTATQIQVGLTQTATQSQGLTQSQVGLTQTATEGQVELTQTATQIQGLSQTQNQARRKRCRECDGCRATKCGNCKYCFHPSLKRACMMRKCINLN
ncbi:uncharacterized protein [Dysidea avara]|uniref:uncharacterized protein isoform X36 n=1 Tax=Dysidea avara TaxID=196820 RepID=UPI0033201CFF